MGREVFTMTYLQGSTSMRYSIAKAMVNNDLSLKLHCVLNSFDPDNDSSRPQYATQNYVMMELLRKRPKDEFHSSSRWI